MVADAVLVGVREPQSFEALRVDAALLATDVREVLERYAWPVVPIVWRVRPLDERPGDHIAPCRDGQRPQLEDA